MSQMDSEYDEAIDWTCKENNNFNFDDRLALVYMGKGIRSDMTFFVEWENISVPAHSLIVAAASPVLERSIFDPTNTERVVNIRGCSLADFNFMLTYIYSGSTKNMTQPQAATLLPLAQTFELAHLKSACVQQMRTNLSLQTVCQTYELIYHFENAITNECIVMMQVNMSHLLKDGSLLRMHDRALSQFLTLDKLCIHSELELFGPMLEWADNKCIECQLLPSSANRRHVLKDRLYLIRFAAMNCREFTICLSMVGPDFFSAEEISSTLLHIAMGDKYNDTPITPHFGSVLRMPYVVEKELPLTFSKVHKRRASISSVIDPRSFPELLTIYSKITKNSNVHIVGFIINESPSCKLLLIGLNEQSSPIECVQHKDRIIFNEPIPMGTGGVLKILLRSSGLLRKRQVIAEMNAHDIFVRGGTWTNVTSVLYTCPVRSMVATTSTMPPPFKNYSGIPIINT